MSSQSEIIYDMGYSAREFSDVLCRQFTGESSDFRSESITVNRWKITQKSTAAEIEIEISEQPDRCLGLFRLPVLKVCFQVDDENSASSQAFFHRFHQYFHKGGG
ncbi:MAG: hypothetical protein ACI9LO_001924 [Planctomycetota bacterium]|jgi:hypothetical protein